MIDTRLKVFRSVATLLSFTKAANELFISQPAISKHIQELEKEYGVQLFDRIGNRIQLTRAGQLMLDHACKIIDAYQNLDFDMKKLTEKSGGELRIGASTTISQYVLPELIAEFRKLYPDIRLTLLSGNSHEIEDALAAGRIDLGMVEGIHLCCLLSLGSLWFQCRCNHPFRNPRIAGIYSEKAGGTRQQRLE